MGFIVPPILPKSPATPCPAILAGSFHACSRDQRAPHPPADHAPQQPSDAHEPANEIPHHDPGSRSTDPSTNVVRDLRKAAKQFETDDGR
ncbi:hypothetical protein ACLOJK_029446 [Asimina triloba]